jgi:plasmid stability protein
MNTKTKVKIVGISLPADVKKKVRLKAAERDQSMSAYLTEMIQSNLRREEDGKVISTLSSR